MDLEGHMRSTAESTNGEFQLKVISGTRTILMALNCPEHRRKGLRGFSFYRKREGASSGKWLRSQKVFRSIVPDPKKLVDGKPPVFTTQDFPVQNFLWSDYTADPGTRYEFRILPMYGKPGKLKSAPEDELHIVVETASSPVPSSSRISRSR